MAGDLINGTTALTSILTNSSAFLTAFAPLAYTLVGLGVAGLIISILARNFWR